MLVSHPAEQGQHKDLQKKGMMCGMESSGQVTVQSGAEAPSCSSPEKRSSWVGCSPTMCAVKELAKLCWYMLECMRQSGMSHTHIMFTLMPISLCPEACATATLKCYYGEFL